MFMYDRITFALHLKLTQHCKSIYFNFFFKDNILVVISHYRFVRQWHWGKLRLWDLSVFYFFTTTCKPQVSQNFQLDIKLIKRSVEGEHSVRWSTHFTTGCISSVTQSCPTLCDPMKCSTPGLPVHHQLRSLPKLMSIESVMPSKHPILCCPLLLLLSILPSIRVFSNESLLYIRWPKYWSFSFSISPSNEYSELISFRMDWLGLLAVQRTLKSLLQKHSSQESILPCSAFFIVQLSHPYITTGKTITLTRQTFVHTVISLLFNMLSRLVIALLPRSKSLLISWLQSPSAVILEPKK